VRAKLAIGDALEADILLEPHDLGNCAILDRAQLRRVDGAGSVLFAGLQQVVRAQETADMVMTGWQSNHGLASGVDKQRIQCPITPRDGHRCNRICSTPTRQRGRRRVVASFGWPVALGVFPRIAGLRRVRQHESVICKKPI